MSSYYYVGPPVRGEQARESGHKVDAVSPLNLPRQTKGLLEVFDHAHVVTQPPIYLHPHEEHYMDPMTLPESQARHRHRSLQGVSGLVVLLLVGQGRQKAVPEAEMNPLVTEPEFPIRLLCL